MAPTRARHPDTSSGVTGARPTPPETRDGETRPSIRRQLALILGLAVAPAGLIAALDGVRTYRDAVGAARSAHMNEAIIASQSERDAFVGIRYSLEAIASTPAVRLFDSAECSATLVDWVREFPTYANATVIDKDGLVRCATSPAGVGVDVSDRPWHVKFVEMPRFGVTALDYGRVTHDRVILAFAPIWSGGKLVGNVAVSVRSALLEAITSSPDARRIPRRVAFVDENGGVMLDDRSDPAKGDQGWLPPGGMLATRLGARPEIFTLEREGRPTLVMATAPIIDGRVWMVAAAAPEAVYAGVLARAAAPMAAPILMWLLAIGVAYFAVDRLVVRRLIYLARITRAYGRGKLALRPRTTDNAPREVAMLAEDLAEMAARIETREEELREAAEARRILLMEVYHRVKNNLQMIVSLLSLQERRAVTDAERDTISRIRSRIHSLALVHQKIYGSGDLRRVRLDALVSDILGHLGNSYRGVSADAPELRSRLAPVAETAERATPVAQFLNEAVTNALKYAASANGRPTIDVTLDAGEDGSFALAVANDVTGPVEGRAEALGTRLMAGFARQIDATVTESEDAGRYVVRLHAPPRPADEATV